MYRNSSTGPLRSFKEGSLGAYFSQSGSPIYSGAGALTMEEAQIESETAHQQAVEELKEKAAKVAATVAIVSASGLLLLGGIAVFVLTRKKSR